jgi:TatD DNase family protein
MPAMPDTGLPPQRAASIESRASWTAACVTLAILSISYGAPLLVVVGLKPIQEGLDTDRSVVALAGALVWIGTGLGGILHCFTSSWPHAKRALGMGFMISFAGNITFPKAQQIREAAKQVPTDRLLIETDSPFLAPVPNRGKRNEPAFVAHIADKIAEIHNTTREQIAEITSANANRLFGWGG